MTLLLALCVGVLFAAGAYMLMRRSIVKLVVGLALMGHAANLLIYVAGSGVAPATKGRPPLVAQGSTLPDAPFVDPLPAALILTAIVIGFGIVSFTIVLIKRVVRDVGTDDLNVLISTDR
jgi:multicomponent Na+:H+ antiporter subunit C